MKITHALFKFFKLRGAPMMARADATLPGHIRTYRGIADNVTWVNDAARAGLRRAMLNGPGYSSNEGW